MWFFAIYMACVTIFRDVGSAPFWADRPVVGLMRRFNVFLDPDAIRVWAVRLEHDAAEWRFSDSQAEHQQIDTIRCPIGARGLYVLVKLGNDTLGWQPNFIERRIIWDAVRITRLRLIHEQLDKVLPR